MSERARRPGPTVRTRVEEHFADGTERRHEDRLATEEPLEIRLAWPGAPARRVWVTMRTPGNDFELAAGWLVHEGVDRPGDLAGVAYCTDVDLAPEQEFNVVTVTLAVPPAPIPATATPPSPRAPRRAGCAARTASTRRSPSAAPAGGTAPLPAPDVVRRLPDVLRERQSVFDRTGGVHAAGLFDADGDAARRPRGRRPAQRRRQGHRRPGAGRGLPAPPPAWW